MKNLDQLRVFTSEDEKKLSKMVQDIESGKSIDIALILESTNEILSRYNQIYSTTIYVAQTVKAKLGSFLKSLSAVCTRLDYIGKNKKMPLPEKINKIKEQLDLIIQNINNINSALPKVVNERHPTSFYFLGNARSEESTPLNTPHNLGYNVAEATIQKLQQAGFSVKKSILNKSQTDNPVRRDAVVELPINNFSSDFQNANREAIDITELTPEDHAILVQACESHLNNNSLFHDKDGKCDMKNTQIYKLNGKWYYQMVMEADLSKFSTTEKSQLKSYMKYYEIENGKERVLIMQPIGSINKSGQNVIQAMSSMPFLQIAKDPHTPSFIFADNITTDQNQFSELKVSSIVKHHNGIKDMNQSGLINENTKVIGLNITPPSPLSFIHQVNHPVLTPKIIDEKSSALASVISGVLTGQVKQDEITTNLNQSPSSLAIHSPAPTKKTPSRSKLTYDEVDELSNWTTNAENLIDTYLKIENPNKIAILEYMTANALAMAVCINALEANVDASTAIDVSDMKEVLQKFTEFYYENVPNSRKRVRLCMGLGQDHLQDTANLFATGSHQQIRDALLQDETFMSAAIDGQSLMAFTQLFLNNKLKIENFGAQITSFADINRLIGDACGSIKAKQIAGKMPKISLPCQNRNTWVKMAAHGALSTMPKTDHLGYLNRVIDVAKNDMAVSIKYKSRPSYPKDQVQQSTDELRKLEQHGINLTAGFESEAKVASLNASEKYLQLVKIKEGIGRFYSESGIHNKMRKEIGGKAISVPEFDVKQLFDRSEKGYIGDPWYDNILKEINQDARERFKKLSVNALKGIKRDLINRLPLSGVRDPNEILIMSSEKLADLMLKNMPVLGPSEIFVYFLTQIHRNDIDTLAENTLPDKDEELVKGLFELLDGKIYANTQYGIEYFSKPCKLSEFNSYFKNHMRFKHGLLERLKLTDLGDGGLQFSLAATDNNGDIINRFHRSGAKLEMDAINVNLIKAAQNSVRDHLQDSNVSRLPNLHPKGVTTGADKTTSVKTDIPYQFYHLHDRTGNSTGREAALRLHGLGPEQDTNIPVVLEIRSVSGYEANINHICDPVANPNGSIKPFLPTHDNYQDLSTFIDSLVINSASMAKDIYHSSSQPKVEVPPQHYELMSPMLLQQKNNFNNLQLSGLNDIIKEQYSDLPTLQRQQLILQRTRIGSLDRNAERSLQQTSKNNKPISPYI